MNLKQTEKGFTFICDCGVKYNIEGVYSIEGETPILKAEFNEQNDELLKEEKTENEKIIEKPKPANRKHRAGFFSFDE